MFFSKSLAIYLFARRVLSRHVHLHHRAEVLYGPSGTCPAVDTTTYEIQPVYYSDHVPVNTVFDPFHNGHLFTVTNAPTMVVITAYVTTVITPSNTIVRPPNGETGPPNGAGGGVTSISLPGGQGSQSLRRSSPLPSVVMTGPPPPPVSSSPSKGSETIPFQSSTSSDSSKSSHTAPLQSQPTTAPDITDMSPQTTPSETVSSISPPITQPPLTIGDGVPTGRVTAVPSTSPILLAFNDLMVANAPRVARRQNDQGNSAGPSVTQITASAVSVVNLGTVSGAAPSGSPAAGGLSQDNCDDATPFYLENGHLMHNDSAVGKYLGVTTALLGPLQGDVPPDQVNNTFSILDGFLQWSAPDVGDAKFFSCRGVLYAGFPNAPDNTCSQVAVGAVAASKCSSRVQQTGTVNPSFIVPQPTISSSTSESVILAGTSSTLPNLSNTFTTRPSVPQASASSSVIPSSLGFSSSTSTSSILSSSIVPISSSETFFPPFTSLLDSTPVLPSISPSTASIALPLTSLLSGVTSSSSTGTNTITTPPPSGTGILSLATTFFPAISISTLSTNVTTASPRIPVTSGLPVYQSCNQDNCLRNLADTRYYTSAGPFCSSYTVSSAYPTPTWLDGCNANPSRISSACSCLLPQSTDNSGSSYTTSSFAAVSDVVGIQSTAATISSSTVLQPSSSTSGDFGTPITISQSSMGSQSRTGISVSTPAGSISSGSVSISSKTSAAVFSSSLTGSTLAFGTTISPSATSSSTSVRPTTTGQLCTGQNIGIGGSTVGAYNYQVVERDIATPFSYEIECYSLLTASPVGSLRAGIATFEDCIDACSQINQDSGAGSCQGVSYNATLDACLLHNAIMGVDYPYFGGQNVYSARLIYAYWPVINDAFYLQYSSFTSNLGLCVNNAFFHDVITPQWVGGAFDNSYENICGQYPGGSNPVDPAYVAAYAAQLPGNISPGGIQTTEDCLKVCDYANHYMKYQCAMYTYDTTYHLCSLYGNTDGHMTVNPTVNAGRLLKAAVGYAKPTDRPSATTYATPYQYGSPTAMTSSTGSLMPSSFLGSINLGTSITNSGILTGTTTTSYGAGSISGQFSSTAGASNLIDVVSLTNSVLTSGDTLRSSATASDSSSPFIQPSGSALGSSPAASNTLNLPTQSSALGSSAVIGTTLSPSGFASNILSSSPSANIFSSPNANANLLASSSTGASNLIDAVSATKTNPTSTRNASPSSGPNSPDGSSTSFSFPIPTPSNTILPPTSLLNSVNADSSASAQTGFSLSGPSMSISAPTIAADSHSMPTFSATLNLPSSFIVGAIGVSSSLAIPSGSVGSLITTIPVPTQTVPTPSALAFISSFSVSMPNVPIPSGSLSFSAYSLSLSLSLTTPGVAVGAGSLSVLATPTLSTPSIPNIFNSISTPSIPNGQTISVNPNLSPSVTFPSAPTLPSPSLSLSVQVTPPIISTPSVSLSLNFPVTSFAFPSVNIPVQNLPTCPKANLLPANTLSVSDGQGHNYLATTNPSLVTITICTIVSITSATAATSTNNNGQLPVTTPAISLNAPTASTSLGAVITTCTGTPQGGFLNLNGQYYITFEPQSGFYVTACANPAFNPGLNVNTPSITIRNNNLPITTASGLGYGTSSQSPYPTLPASSSLPGCGPGTQGNNGPSSQFFTILDPILQAYVTVCAAANAGGGATLGIGYSSSTLGLGAGAGASVVVGNPTVAATVSVNLPGATVSVGASVGVVVDVGAGTTGVGVGAGGGAGGGVGVGIGSTSIVDLGAGLGGGASVGIGVRSSGVVVGVGGGVGVGIGSSTIAVGVGAGATVPVGVSVPTQSISVGVGVGVGVNVGVTASVSVDIAGLPCIGVNCGSGSATTSSGIGYGGVSSTTTAAVGGGGQNTASTTRFTSSTAAATTTTHSLSPFVSSTVLCVFALPCSTIPITLYI